MPLVDGNWMGTVPWGMKVEGCCRKSYHGMITNPGRLGEKAVSDQVVFGDPLHGILASTTPYHTASSASPVSVASLVSVVGCRVSTSAWFNSGLWIFRLR